MVFSFLTVCIDLGLASACFILIAKQMQDFADIDIEISDSLIHRCAYLIIFDHVCVSNGDTGKPWMNIQMF